MNNNETSKTTGAPLKMSEPRAIPRCLHCYLIESALEYARAYEGVDIAVDAAEIDTNKIPTPVVGGIALSLAKAAGEFAGSVPRPLLQDLLFRVSQIIVAGVRHVSGEQVAVGIVEVDADGNIRTDDGREPPETKH